MKPGGGAEDARRPLPRWLGAPGFAERVGQLDLVEPVVAADHDQQRLGVVADHTGSALISAPGGTSSSTQTCSTVLAPGVSTRSGASSGSGSPSTGCGVALATSTLAA